MMKRSKPQVWFLVAVFLMALSHLRMKSTENEKSVSSSLRRRDDYQSPLQEARNNKKSIHHGHHQASSSTKKSREQQVHPPSSISSGDKLHGDKTLVIGGGRGTTGTHLMFETTCHLGFPSHHWNIACIPGAAANNSTRSIPKRYRKSYRKLESLQSLVYFMHLCLERKQQGKGKGGTCGSALEWKESVLNAIHRVLKDGYIHSLHDNPYPYLMPSLLKAANRYYKKTVIVLSERDPEEYAKRRSSLSNAYGDPICIDRTLPTVSPTTSIDPQTLSGGGFDLIGCINRAIARLSPTEDAAKLDLTRVFTTFGAVDSSSEEGWKIIAEEVRQYQEAVRGLADFSFDMFVREEKTKREDLAKQMAERVPSLSINEPPAQLVDWWEGTIIETTQN